eukprot:TRINITY_DN58782_c0_g1_i2.p3 TRINITY_DN58782_c0_g1~~TRINITY_DN58782_c0_g1_i2.p3  ORF type:complete len:141 (+),score=32.47 TRINITY_DN58782_c0_g1_i2:381-803(+)
MEVRRSPLGGRGVFAKSAIASGDLVEVAPVLAMRRDHIAAECSGMRYFFSSSDGDVLLCVLGWGMLYNHGRTPAETSAGKGSELFANLKYSLCIAPENARDDADGGLCVIFEAVRDIQASEELLIDYSERWWQAKGLEPL